MSKAVKAVLSAAGILVLCTLSLAQSGANTANIKQEHHSRLAKAAFWRHHKAGDKNAKPAPATRAESQPAQPKTAQLKAVSARRVTGQKNQKPEPPASKTVQPSPKKSTSTQKPKLQSKAQASKTASGKQ